MPVPRVIKDNGVTIIALIAAVAFALLYFWGIDTVNSSLSFEDVEIQTDDAALADLVGSSGNIVAAC